jgi:Hemerythrin HHE cation binding domain
VDYKLDMSAMLAIHQALRRDLERLGRIAARPDGNGNPARLLQASAGWEQFKEFLVAHHTAEDRALWPALREAVAASPDQVAIADALEDEHSVIEPLLTAIDAAAVDPDTGHQRFGDIIDELIAKLSAHLKHEETEGFALIDASLTPAQWQHFAAVNADLVRPEAPNYMPWLLSEADQATLDAVLGKFPPQLVTAFREQWAPAYTARDIWKGL